MKQYGTVNYSMAQIVEQHVLLEGQHDHAVVFINSMVKCDISGTVCSSVHLSMLLLKSMVQ
jgi:hypothetical protein